MLIGNIDILSRRGQEVLMVLYALRELRRIRTKEEVLRFIRQNRFYELLPEDKESYESKREWKSDTLLCFARKDAVENDLMFDHDEKDSWEITRGGLDTLDAAFAKIRGKGYPIERYYMWRPEFKKIVDPTYIPSPRDHVRRAGSPRMTLLERALALLTKLSTERETSTKA